jgi:hypothetical protein
LKAQHVSSGTPLITRNDDISFDKIPKSETVQQVRDQSIAKWQIHWDRTTKGLTTKQFFPIIKDRLTTKIKLTPNFTALVNSSRQN